MTKNPTKPILTVFLSYSKADLQSIIPLVDGLRQAHIEVNLYQQNEPLSVRIDQWVMTEIAECDCMIVVISKNSLREQSKVAREVGLAMTLFEKKGELAPEIVAVILGGFEGTEKFQPRNFHDNNPIGQPIDWSKINCITLDSENSNEAIEKFIDSLSPKTFLITNPEDSNQKPLFRAAIDLYENLLPIERERDQEADIIHWINESWEDGKPENGSEWLHTLAVHHIGEKVIGILWCSVHKTTGIGFVSFWGLLASHRAYNRGAIFATEVINDVKLIIPNLRALLFAAERVKWNVLDDFLEDSLEIWRTYHAESSIKPNWYSILSDPLDNEPSAISQMLHSISEQRRQELIYQLRQYRRFFLYTNGVSHNKILRKVGVRLMAFIKPDGDVNESKDLSLLMADFVQPPIRKPVSSVSDSHLWLFALVFDDCNLPASEALDWIYDSFLKDSLGKGLTQLIGWNEYMVGFKEKWRDLFVSQAQLKFLRLRDWFKPYDKLENEVRKHWLQEKAMGRVSGNWDTEL